ncbi:hypothetical protein N7535_001428 [Penicillium sp. DV-2018c]|nr:hypothetical protein N7461_005325 [Penicillium sp. DV-2018c]KAJ5582808.1 hypothetical protein N7535_001428 [Penicillium sp. DV-2018c]
MQRVIQRTASARKQAMRRTNKIHERQELLERVGIRRARKDYGGQLSSQFQAARKSRWEDWEKGPLAPMRDSGLEATTYGGQAGTLLHPPTLPKHEQRRHVLFAEGDRVCVMRGRDQGKVSVIQQVNRASETVLIKGVNMGDVIIPEWAKDRTGLQSDTAPQPFPVSFDDIRHVIPLEDTETGKTQHVIVEHAYAAGPYTERAPHSKIPRYTRYVSGMDIEIPWPLEEEPVIKDGEMDTTRMAAETVTFTPTLAQPPMPSSVIDELRNKYSRFRTRHDPEYLKAKMMEDYRVEYRKTVSMMTPKTEAQNLKIARFAEQNKAKVEAGLTKASLNFIAKYLESQAISVPPEQKKKAKNSKAKQAA